MERGHSQILWEMFTQVDGCLIKSMGTALKLGLKLRQNIKVNIKMD
jgi:hypothetical protein